MSTAEEIRGWQGEITILEDKKRLGSKQKLRLAELKYRVAQAGWTPRPNRAPSTARGPFAYDHDGSMWRTRVASHNASPGTGRMARRAQRFGRNGIKPFRSRIQRQTRKRRTGGVK